MKHAMKFLNSARTVRVPGRPKPDRVPSGDRRTYPSDEGLS
jgi:hypothetical protein